MDNKYWMYRLCSITNIRHDKDENIENVHYYNTCISACQLIIKNIYKSKFKKYQTPRHGWRKKWQFGYNEIRWYDTIPEAVSRCSDNIDCITIVMSSPCYLKNLSCPKGIAITDCLFLPPFLSELYLWKFDDCSSRKQWLVVCLSVWLLVMMLIFRLPLYSASFPNHSIKFHYRPPGQNIKIADYCHAQYRLSCIWELSALCTLVNQWKNSF